MTKDEVLKLALEALNQATGMCAERTSTRRDIDEAITALRQALKQPEREPFCFHDGRNIVGKEYADHSDVFPLYTSPNPEQQKPVRFNCTVIDDAHLNGVPLSQWGKQHEMQPCAGRNCGSTNPNLHSAECFEDYEKATGMEQPEQEPVDSPEKAGAYMDARLWEFIYMAAAWPEAKTDTRIWDHVLVYAPKRPEQEPVAWNMKYNRYPKEGDLLSQIRLVSRREWVELTFEEADRLASKYSSGFRSDHNDALDLVGEVEALLKEKNT